MRLFTLLPLLVSIPSFGQNYVEFTPVFGYRLGGEFNETTPEHTEITFDDNSSYGAILSWPYDHQRKTELLISHYNTQLSSSATSNFNNTDIGVTYAHLGGSVSLTQHSLPLWLSGGLGVTHFSPSNNQLSSDTQFSMNLGIDSNIQLSEQLALKFGGKIYATLFDSDGSILCDSNACVITVDSELWLQSEVFAGISFKF